MIMPGSANDMLTLGRIASVHGVRGEIKVYSYTDPIGNLLDYRHWTLKRGVENLQVEVVRGRVQGQVLVVKLKGLDDRELAKTYAHFDICIPSVELPSLDDGEFYWHQLVGLRVVNQSQQLLGCIDHLLETGANDVMVLRSCPGSLDERERLLPYTDQCVLSIDLDAGLMQVDWDAEF